MFEGARTMRGMNDDVKHVISDQCHRYQHTRERAFKKEKYYIVAVGSTTVWSRYTTVVFAAAICFSFFSFEGLRLNIWERIAVSTSSDANAICDKFCDVDIIMQRATTPSQRACLFFLRVSSDASRSLARPTAPPVFWLPCVLQGTAGRENVMPGSYFVFCIITFYCRQSAIVVESSHVVIRVTDTRASSSVRILFSPWRGRVAPFLLVASEKVVVLWLSRALPHGTATILRDYKYLNVLLVWRGRVAPILIVAGEKSCRVLIATSSAPRHCFNTTRLQLLERIIGPCGPLSRYTAI